MNNGQGMIFNLQRFCLHDGPGIRTVVFLKGCPLRCMWCSNPESQEAGAQLMHNRTLCRRCGLCLPACPNKALTAGPHGIEVDRERCRNCGACAKACPWLAMKISGRLMSVDEVMAEIRKDIPFYTLSGGGVTFSGGEPGWQSDFVLEVMRRCRELGIPTALETSGRMEPEAMRRMAGYCELILFDVKHTDDAVLRRVTGVRTELIFENLRAAALLTTVVVRVPLVPDVNMNTAFYESLSALLSDIPIQQVELLPYHRLGAGKYDQLGRVYAGSDQTSEEFDIAAAANALRARLGIPVTTAE